MNVPHSYQDYSAYFETEAGVGIEDGRREGSSKEGKVRTGV